MKKRKPTGGDVSASALQYIRWMSSGENQGLKTKIVAELLRYVETLQRLRALRGRKNISHDFYEIRVKEQVVAVNVAVDLLAEYGINVDERAQLLEAWTKI